MRLSKKDVKEQEPEQNKLSEKQEKKKIKKDQFESFYEEIVKDIEEDHSKEKDARLDEAFLKKVKLDVDTKVIFMLQKIEKFTKEKFTTEEFNVFYRELDRNECKMNVSLRYNSTQKAYVVSEKNTGVFFEVLFDRHRALFNAFSVLYDRREEKKNKPKLFGKCATSKTVEDKNAKVKANNEAAKRDNQTSDKATITKETRSRFVKMLLGERNRDR